MVANITLPHSNLVGPGLPIGAVSDFIGPLATGSHWIVTIAGPSPGSEDTLWQAFQNSQVANILIRPMDLTIPTPTGALGITNNGQTKPSQMVTEGTQVKVIASLQDPFSTVIDQTSVLGNWDSTGGTPFLVHQQSEEGAFTTTDRNQLQAVLDALTTTIETATGTIAQSVGSALNASTLDSLTLEEITSGPTGDFVGHNLTAFVFGIIIRIATIPPDLNPQTPDGDWFIPDLAVVRIFHGDDLFMRRGIHTSSAIIPFDESKSAFVIEAVEVALWPSAVTLQVTWRPGVTGQVFLMRFP